MRTHSLVLLSVLAALAACSPDNPVGPPATSARPLASATAVDRGSAGQQCDGQQPPSAGARGRRGTLSTASTCIRDSCVVGPTIPCEQLLYDTTFDDNCPFWVANAYAVRGSTSLTGAYYDLWGKRTALLYQDVGDLELYNSPPFASMDMMFEVEVINRASAGSEHMRVEIRDAGTNALLQTVKLVVPSTTPDGQYPVNLSNFSGRVIRLQFRVVPGSTPGNTYFRVHKAFMWGYW